MAEKVKIKFWRGLESARTGVTPDEGIPIWTTDTKKLYVGDGITAGGVIVTGGGGASGDPNFVGENQAATPAATGLNSLAMGSGAVASADNSVALGSAVNNAVTNTVEIGTSNTNKMVLDEEGNFKVPAILGERVNNIGVTGGGTQDIDLNLGTIVTATVNTSANTFTFSNHIAATHASAFTLFLTNGGSQTVTWPVSVVWGEAIAPTLIVAGLDVLTFVTPDFGTTWYGFSASTSGDMLSSEYDTIIDANTAKVSNVDHPLVETAVPVGALFTDNDTIYDPTGTAFLATQNQFTQTQNSAPVELFRAGNSIVPWDASTQQVVFYTAAALVTTMAAPTGQVAGAFYNIKINNNIGANSIGWDFGTFRFVGGNNAGSPSLSETIGAVDFITFRSDGTLMFEVGRAIDVKQ